ncbi:hypothetical protein GbCGDNIH6_8210 [Granulibacter bethesdensis]|nr:hypothetical protein GbCGDNIH6_8210 [Granulibacter bethesdensis]
MMAVFFFRHPARMDVKRPLSYLSDELRPFCRAPIKARPICHDPKIA